MSVPFALVRAYHAMLPRLMAEEAMLAAQTVGLGTGSLNERQTREVKARLARAAQPHGPRTAGTASPEALAAIGIGVTPKG